MLTHTDLKVNLDILYREYQTIEHLVKPKPNYQTHFPIQNMLMFFPDTIPEQLQGSYTEAVYHQVNSIIQVKTICYRVLMPNSCYGMHIDRGLKVHVPITSNDGCMFLYKDKDGIRRTDTAPADGSVYQFDPTTEHTFINASTIPRIHLMFDEEDFRNL